MPVDRPAATARRFGAAALMLLLAGAGAPAVAGQDRPSAELLEFLGRFTTDDGRWVDPMALSSPRPAPPSDSGNERDVSETYRAGHDENE